MNNKKITSIFIILFIIGLIIVGTTLSSQMKRDKYFNRLNYEEFMDKIKNEESFPLLFIKNDCNYCAAFKPKVLEAALESKTVIYYINLSRLTDEENIAISKLFPISGTPTMIFVKDGKEQYINNRLVGNTSKSVLIENLKINKFID